MARPTTLARFGLHELRNAGLKDCCGCGERKRIDEFWRNSSRTDGLHIWCKVCESAGQRKRRERDPSYYSRLSRRSRYGLADGQFESMLERQGGCCAACGDELVDERKSHLDHDHVTGRPRGVLCIHCNWALGHLRDDADRIGKLLAYLLRCQ